MKFSTVVISALLLASCSDTPTDSTATSTLDGSWALQSLEPTGSSAIQIGEPDRYTAEFASTGQLSVRSDCNRCSSFFRATGAALDIQLLACTRAYCGDESLDSDYVAALDAATSFARSSDLLTIRYPGGSLRFAPASQVRR